MRLPSLMSTSTPASMMQPTEPQAPSLQGPPSELREAFDQFVGEAFFGQLLGAMRKTVGKPAYFYGGRAEEIFQGQLDQTLAEEMTKASADTFTGPMFELFNLQRN
jgi:peptidoglycan hydrolase FlgJ